MGAFFIFLKHSLVENVCIIAVKNIFKIWDEFTNKEIKTLIYFLRSMLL